jgi:WhiB family redox-sensing transcriptional regulator
VYSDIQWMDAGNCRTLPAEDFFPSDGVGVAAAQRVCASCPVRQQCLDDAIAHHITHGVWGGTTERGRRTLARRMARAAQ